ncbi:hypothetical protein pdam_00020787 [Pocillopora damicornis]|uniref:Uncharacterized protein n=1 Tax=Pocillopora damicornis TaxID=46731 RepID=A0A3M6UN10_POCDA|nr:hypothetical protein pdam_00020787 [Pocillopora damicornis]
MILYGVKLNEEKTELLLLSSRYRPSPSLELSRDLSLSLMVIEDFLMQDLNYGTAYPHLKEMPIP